MTVSMTALTLRQPWASLISSGGKLFESRTWAPPVPLIGQRIAIHAGKSKISNGLSDEELAAIRSGLDADDLAALPRGMIVCTARIAGAYRVGAFCGTSNRITFDDRVAGSPTVDNIVVQTIIGYLSFFSRC